MTCAYLYENLQRLTFPRTKEAKLLLIFVLEASDEHTAMGYQLDIHSRAIDFLWDLLGDTSANQVSLWSHIDVVDGIANRVRGELATMLRELTSMKMFIRVLALMTVWSLIYVNSCIESDQVRVEQALKLTKKKALKT